MNTLKDHTILYDDECPLCAAYTSAFVKTGMLDDNGRTPYTLGRDEYAEHINRVRACDEIALINRKENKVYYGLESLLIIIGNSFPVFRPLFKVHAFKWTLSKIYSFVSYNRKVIIPGRKMLEANSCVPSFNLKYRFLYLVFTWIITSLILHRYSALLVPYVPAGSFTREFMICGGQILFQAMVLNIVSKNNVWDYLGNMMTISLAGSLLLMTGTIFTLITTSPLLFLAWFGLVVALMFAEHLRRMKLLSISAVASVSWVAYRVIVLFITDVF